jgi:hypothetical protein
MELLLKRISDFLVLVLDMDLIWRTVNVCLGIYSLLILQRCHGRTFHLLVAARAATRVLLFGRRSLRRRTGYPVSDVYSTSACLDWNDGAECTVHRRIRKGERMEHLAPAGCWPPIITVVIRMSCRLLPRCRWIFGNCPSASL